MAKKEKSKRKSGLAGIGLLLLGAAIIAGGIALSSRFQTPSQSSSSDSDSASEASESAPSPITGVSAAAGSVVF